MQAIEIDDRIDLETSRRGPPADFPPLPQIPGGRYVRADFAALETEYLWRRSWVCAGRLSELPRRGSYRLFRKLGMPILLVRGHDDRVRAFYNTCRHRGAPVVRAESGCANLLRCQFHSWSYGLDGRLVAVPDLEDFPGLDKAGRGLLEIRCEAWDGWLFVNLDPAAEPLLDILGGLAPELASAGMARLRLVERRSYIAECNWKTTMDAFIEVYHLNTIHQDTAGAVLDYKASTIALLPGGHSRQASRRREALGDRVAEQGDTPDIAGIADRFRRLGISYNIFPNLVTPIDPVGFPVLLMWPRGVRQCEIEIYFLGPDWGEGPRPGFYDGYFAFFEQLMQEDLANLAPIQESLDSGAFTGALVGYQERRIYWLHEAIDRSIGLANIPLGLAVEPLLGPHAEQPSRAAAE